MSIDQPIADSPTTPLATTDSPTTSELGVKRPRSPSLSQSSLKRANSGPVGDARTRGFFIAYIDNAFRQLAQGKPEDYHAIVNVFAPWLRQDLDGDLEAAAAAAGAVAEPPARMRAWLDALTHTMPRMEAAAHSQLIETILSITWTAMDELCIGPYVRFTAALLGSKPEYTGFVLKRAIKGLHYRTGLRNSSASDVTRRIAYDRVHRLLQTLVETVPTVPSVLLRQLSTGFPNSRDGREAHIVYSRNALRTIEYCPAFFDDILSAVIAAALRIDAEIQVEIDEFEDDAGKLDQEVFGVSADPFDRAVGDDADSEAGGDDELAFSDISSDYEGQVADEDDTSKPSKPQAAPMAPEVVARLKELAAKLDSLMSVIFAFLDRAQKEDFSKPKRPESPMRTPLEPLTAEELAKRRSKLFDTLSLIFERTILSTFKTRHTQFLMFWLLSLDPTFAERFIVLLYTKAFYEADEVAVVTRVASLCYLASFVSRAAFVDATSARNVLSLLSTHIKDHLDRATVDFSNSKSVVQQHAVFYAAVQAAFYIFCFRWRDFQLSKEELAGMDDEASKFIPQLDVLKRAVVSPFNPLRICSANVSTQFARVAHRVEFMYCFSVIEQNKRLDEADVKTPLANIKPSFERKALPTPPLVQQALHDARMDSHFPFDPYKLPLSGTYLTGLYREWQDPDPNEEAEDEDDLALGTPENGIAIPSSMAAAGQLRPAKKDKDADKISSSFNAMSLSPLSPEGLNPRSLRQDEMQPMSLVL